MSQDSVNFKVSTGNTLDFQVNYFADETETAAVNLTGYTVAMKVKDSVGTVFANSSVGTAGITMTATITTPASGIIDLLIPPATTVNFPVGTLYYDVQLTHTASGNKYVILDGELTVRAGIT